MAAASKMSLSGKSELKPLKIGLLKIAKQDWWKSKAKHEIEDGGRQKTECGKQMAGKNFQKQH